PPGLGLPFPFLALSEPEVGDGDGRVGVEHFPHRRGEMTTRTRSIVIRLASVGAIGFVVLGASPDQPAVAVPSATTERVSIGTGGEQGNDMSGRFAGPAIDGDGSVVAFDSAASTLVPGDTNGE